MRTFPKGRIALLWLLAGLIFSGIGFVSSWTRGVNITDESWFLQVLYRVSSGGVLYRDMFFGATPLSVYLTLIPVSIFGAEILVIKTVMAVCYAITTVLVAGIGRQFGQKLAGQFVLIGACLIFSLPATTSPYKAFAQIFFLLCFSVTLRWLQRSRAENGEPEDRKSMTLLFLAGAFSGLCFLCYQNWGVYAFGALFLTILAGSANRPGKIVSRSFKYILGAGLGFALAAIIVLLPVWISGGFDKLIDYGFLNKSTYVETAGLSYFDNLALLFSFLQIQNWNRFRLFYQNSLFLLPPAVFFLLALTWWRATLERKRMAVCVLVFTTAGFLAIFPRVDWPHFLYSIPSLLLALAYCWQELGQRVPARDVRRLQAALLLWIALCFTTEIVTTAMRLTREHEQVSSLPHFHGALFPADQYAMISEARLALEKVGTHKQPVLIIPEAAFYYLITGLHDPSPFDYPLVTAFGRNGEKDLIAEISQGQVDSVCLRSLRQTALSTLRPALIEDFVQSAMQPKEDLGVCVLYENR